VFPLGILQENPCKVVNNNSKAQYQNVNRNKCHIEVATTPQQKHPPVFVGQKKVEGCNYREEDREME
jgi:hypothetical protein